MVRQDAWLPRLAVHWLSVTRVDLWELRGRCPNQRPFFIGAVLFAPDPSPEPHSVSTDGRPGRAAGEGGEMFFPNTVVDVP